jgi:hypothetical protein
MGSTEITRQQSRGAHLIILFLSSIFFIWKKKKKKKEDETIQQLQQLALLSSVTIQPLFSLLSSQKNVMCILFLLLSLLLDFIYQLLF